MSVHRAWIVLLPLLGLALLWPVAAGAQRAGEADRRDAQSEVEEILRKLRSQRPRPSTPLKQPTGEPLTASERDVVKARIEKCSSVDPCADWPEGRVVRVVLMVSPTGEVVDVRPFDQDLYQRDATYRAAYAAGRRAVFCAAPFDLPPAKYSHWQVMLLTFGPGNVREPATECKNGNAGHKAGDELGGW